MNIYKNLLSKISLGFLLSSGFRFLGPVVLALAAPLFIGASQTQSLFVFLAALLLGTTIGKFGIENQILKSIHQPSRQIALLWTSSVWLVLSGISSFLAVDAVYGNAMADIGVTMPLFLLIYAVVYLGATISALLQASANVRYVQFFEFGSFQTLLIFAIVVQSLFGVADITAALAISGTILAAAITIYIIRNPRPFLQKETLTAKLVQERANGLVPNLITYTSSWGLFLPLEQLPAELASELIAAVKIGAAATGITTIANILSLGDSSGSTDEKFARSRRLSIAILLPALVLGIPLYLYVHHLTQSLPDPASLLVLTIYAVHIAVVILGPAMFFANVVGHHGRINLAFLGLLLSSALCAFVIADPLVSFLWLLIYSRLIIRLIVSKRL